MDLDAIVKDLSQFKSKFEPLLNNFFTSSPGPKFDDGAGSKTSSTPIPADVAARVEMIVSQLVNLQGMVYKIQAQVDEMRAAMAVPAPMPPIDQTVASAPTPETAAPDPAAAMAGAAE